MRQILKGEMFGLRRYESVFFEVGQGKEHGGTQRAKTRSESPAMWVVGWVGGSFLRWF